MRIVYRFNWVFPRNGRVSFYLKCLFIFSDSLPHTYMQIPEREQRIFISFCVIFQGRLQNVFLLLCFCFAFTPFLSYSLCCRCFYVSSLSFIIKVSLFFLYLEYHSLWSVPFIKWLPNKTRAANIKRNVQKKTAEDEREKNKKHLFKCIVCFIVSHWISICILN